MARRAEPGAQAALAVAVTVVFFAWLYLPILAVALFSFNDKKSLSAFSGFSTPLVRRPSSTTMPCSTRSCQPRDRPGRDARLAGARTMLALGLERVRSRRSRVGRRGHPAPAGHPRDRHRGRRPAALHRAWASSCPPAPSMLAEITFSIAYVTVIVRGRLAGLALEVEEAARDLGCTPFAGAAPGHPARPSSQPSSPPGCSFRAGLRRLRARLLHHRRRPPAAARSDLLVDPVRCPARHQRRRHPDARRSSALIVARPVHPAPVQPRGVASTSSPEVNAVTTTTTTAASAATTPHRAVRSRSASPSLRRLHRRRRPRPRRRAAASSSPSSALRAAERPPRCG